MALTRRTVAASLAGLALAGAAAQPASAYWHTTGRGTGTVATATAAPRVITLTLSTQGNRIGASGAAGTTTPYGTAPVTVTVVLCRENTWPCSSVAATLTATASSGTYSALTPGGTSFKNVTVYGLASQTQTAGWTDYSVVPPPVTP